MYSGCPIGLNDHHLPELGEKYGRTDCLPIRLHDCHEIEDDLPFDFSCLSSRKLPLSYLSGAVVLRLYSTRNCAMIHCCLRLRPSSLRHSKKGCFFQVKPSQASDLLSVLAQGINRSDRSQAFHSFAEPSMWVIIQTEGCKLSYTNRL